MVENKVVVINTEKRCKKGVRYNNMQSKNTGNWISKRNNKIEKIKKLLLHLQNVGVTL